ncbi:helix-turn-helix transcriptional regulator [Sagittula salina]|uniref:Response regulator transcription factor n=1 Tax=Sagittula salina TaxID=2820268 RepID=A0A940S3U1_9RHOB|nr:LuxR C-terminal-related transcriptional regulator [Sagittula salina]MBP0483409.1 response regulator transcription factor [Sagittula salina]
MKPSADAVPLSPAETFFPERGQRFLRGLESTRSSNEVWELLMQLGRDVNLPSIDFISASDWRHWKRTLFVRNSYDATWLHAMNQDSEQFRGSYFRVHGLRHLTPLCVGLEFREDYPDLPPDRLSVLQAAADRGLRAGIAIPLRQTAPPSAAMLSFIGDHDREALLEILKAECWTLTVGAWAAHQRYMQHFSEEFFVRNGVTPKQRELLEMIGAGYLDKEIARTLGITVSAVRQRLSALIAKTGACNRAELAALAMSLGVLPDPHNRPLDEGDGDGDGAEVYPRVLE